MRREVGPVCVAYTLVGLSFGAMTTAGGVPGWVAPLMAATIFAGGAQFAAMGIALAGGGVLAAVLAGLVVNTRLLVYGLAVPDVSGRGVVSRLAGAHLITDVNTALALRETDAKRRRALFWRAGLLIFVTWNLAVALGVLLGDRVADAHRLGLDAVLPIILFALARPQLSDRRTRDCAGLGVGLAFIGQWFLPPGLPVLIALAGCLQLVRRDKHTADHGGSS